MAISNHRFEQKGVHDSEYACFAILDPSSFGDDG
jgi:hypothetical protein